MMTMDETVQVMILVALRLARPAAWHKVCNVRGHLQVGSRNEIASWVLSVLRYKVLH